MNTYDNKNYAIPNKYHDTAKAFLIDLDTEFETSEMDNNECCFALYDLHPDKAYRAKQFLEQECNAVLLPF